ncbi:hypothetical protein JG687_00015168 [Phytophthora cactorum]|uniref:Uncharacterized protein n=1 Tax=Phytophthora cactorum TaxID=29920 RepID=A0A329RWR4_9STRA|nr:hypothetical protein Pcac1_g19038 [Phytophthora cactorum]KAG2821502.1 hypothetical protein PC112_g11351 [Phytophthora cactorum]KAG2856047.1 hypothetical protein PC113_g11914 [Phytophthora cactorum]KAG2893390.1 hypothetical protein PC114_g16291 [Phytophthora cactorum]KAG2923764.1 hypothetical protein PC117_g15628 [Phytophthora cactorum]
MVAKVSKDEFEAALRIPFLSVLYDSCTTGSSKKDAVCTSVCFITWNWYFCSLVLLVTVHNGSHQLCKVKTLITSRIEKFYGIAIEEMAQFTMSDTTHHGNVAGVVQVVGAQVVNLSITDRARIRLRQLGVDKADESRLHGSRRCRRAHCGCK